jgi:hypothetical protein
LVLLVNLGDFVYAHRLRPDDLKDDPVATAATLMAKATPELTNRDAELITFSADYGDKAFERTHGHLGTDWPFLRRPHFSSKWATSGLPKIHSNVTCTASPLYGRLKFLNPGRHLGNLFGSR